METSHLEQHIRLLNERNKTCIVLSNVKIIFESEAFGVKPLRELRQSGFKKQPEDHLTLIDRVIGKGALILAQLIGIDEIFTPLTSQHALRYSQVINLPITYQVKVPMIQNRTRTGMCPIEESVINTSDPHTGEANIEAAITLLMKQAR